MELLLVAMALFVAFNNGANDNFKGFATVWGSDTLSYRQALALATLATLAGSLASWFLADTLIQQFSGKGLVPNEVANSSQFILGVATGAGLTVFLATRLGFPVSTTHALIGGLIGAGLGQVGGDVAFGKLADGFLLPLLISPLVAASLGVVVYKLLGLRTREKDCACVVADNASPRLLTEAVASPQVVMPAIVIAKPAVCDSLNTQARFSISSVLDRCHVASAMTICFARGLNDTPKLAALLIAAQYVDQQMSVAMIGLVMAAGGLIYARQVAETMSHRVTRMDHAQGLSANLITATLVLFASHLGMPVSTTHVSVGSIAGVGASAQTLNWGTFRNVLLSWLATLPLAALTAWLMIRLF